MEVNLIGEKGPEAYSEHCQTFQSFSQKYWTAKWYNRRCLTVPRIHLRENEKGKSDNITGDLPNVYGVILLLIFSNGFFNG